ncbi:MAG: TolC family protein [Taibaiella sp.]|nr:TolC family protein [Taibaiella sp.]
MKKWLFFFSFIAIKSISYGQSVTLQYYIDQSLANSPLLKDYRNQILAAKIDSQRIRALYKPQVTGTSNNFYAPVINGYGYDPVVTNNGSYNALLNVDQAFIGRRNLNAQFASIHLQNDSFSNTGRITEQELIRTVTNQYITAYGDLQQLNLNTEINELLKNEDTILRKLTQSNIYRQTDYLTFKVTLQQQQLQLRQLNIQYQTDYSTLNYLCGIYDTAYVTLSPPAITLQDLPDRATSIHFRQYSIDSLKLMNTITVLNYSYRPKVNAYANAGYNSSLLYQSYKNFGTGVGLNLNVPIYDGHQRKLLFEKIKLQENTRANYQDFFIRQYSQQTVQLRRQLRLTEDLINDINEQIKYSETLIKVDGKLMETGDTRISDFVIAINNYLNARNLLAQNNISRMQIINQLNYWNR